MSVTTQIQPRKRFLLSQSSPCGKKTTSRELEDAMNVVKTIVVLLDLHILRKAVMPLVEMLVVVGLLTGI